MAVQFPTSTYQFIQSALCDCWSQPIEWPCGNVQQGPYWLHQLQAQSNNCHPASNKESNQTTTSNLTIISAMLLSLSCTATDVTAAVLGLAAVGGL